MTDKKYKPVPVYIPAELHKAVRIKSVNEGKSINQYLVEKLKEWIVERKTDKPCK